MERWNRPGGPFAGATFGAFAAFAALALIAGCSADSADRDDEGSAATSTSTAAEEKAGAITEYDVPSGSHPHDVAVTSDGIVWYTAQATGKLGRLDPKTGDVSEIDLGDGASPHGVVIGHDGAPWVTETGLNAIVRVDPRTSAVRRFDAPPGRPSLGMHTAAFDQRGVLWFTGSGGFYGRLDPGPATIDVYEAPGGGGPYGITVVPSGDVYFASLAQSYMARVDPGTGAASVLRPPTTGQGTRRVWSDSQGRVWSSQWNAGQVAVYEPATGEWQEWRLPGGNPQAYAVYVDEHDKVWLTDFGANAIVRFDPDTEKFTSYPLSTPNAAVRQLYGRQGEVWGAESSADKLVVIRSG